MPISTERSLKKIVVLETLGDGKLSLSARGIDKPATIMADEVFEVELMRSSSCCCVKSRNYDPSDHDAIVTVSQPLVEAEPITVMGEPSYHEPIVIPTTDL